LVGVDGLELVIIRDPVGHQGIGVGISRQADSVTLGRDKVADGCVSAGLIQTALNDKTDRFELCVRFPDQHNLPWPWDCEKLYQLGARQYRQRHDEQGECKQPNDHYRQANGTRYTICLHQRFQLFNSTRW